MLRRPSVLCGRDVPERMAVLARGRGLRRELDVLRNAVLHRHAALLHGDARPDGDRMLRAGQWLVPDGLCGMRLRGADDPDRDARRRSTIATLTVGDLVYSVNRGSLAVVAIKFVHRQPVTGSHRIVELKLARRNVEDQPPSSDGGRSSFFRPRVR